MLVGGSCDITKAGPVSAMIPDSVADAEQEDQGKNKDEETLMIMLLGKSGAGKSSSGNTILGKNVFKSDMKLQRVTRHCEKATGTTENVPVAVIDTPGFFEKDHDEKVNVREILKSVKLQQPGPHAFVLVIPIGRMTQEDQHTNALIEAIFGPKVWDYTIVLFTHGDRLNEKTLNDVISEADDNLRNFIRKCGGGFHVFNNKTPEEQTQVTSFIAKIHTMMALNGRGHYHMALYPKEERMIRERQMSILAEREAEISSKEKNLQERHQGTELEEKKRELWRKEEDEARLAAEKETKRTTTFWKIARFFFILMVGTVLFCALPNMWPLVVVVFLLWVFFEELQSILGKIPRRSKKNK